MPSLAKGESSYPLPDKDTDGRRDRDADWGVKGGGRKDKKKHYWFGYLLHLVVDAHYELPLGFTVTKASAAEQPRRSGCLIRCRRTIRSCCNGAIG